MQYRANCNQKHIENWNIILFNSHVFHKHTIISGLQSTIKIINLIILAAVRKGYKRSATCRILTCDSLLAGTTLCLQTWCNDAVPCSNFPWKPTRTTQIRKHYYKLTIVNRAKVTILNTGWLQTCSNIDFRSVLTKTSYGLHALNSALFFRKILHITQFTDQEICKYD